MTRGPFIVGLFLSALVHLCLLIPGGERVVRSSDVVGVIETELAALDVPEIEVTALAKPPSPATELSDTVPSAPPPALQPEPKAREPAPPAEVASTKVPAVPALVRSADSAESSLAEQGDVAGESEGRSAPELRIDWGTAQRAFSVLEAGQMKVIVLREGAEGAAPIISEAVERHDGIWQRRSYASTAMLFSNNLRIVDGVPAFDQIAQRSAFGGRNGSRCWYPEQSERLLQSAQLEAAFRRGLTMERIRSFGGTFTVTDGVIGFEITQVWEGESS